MQLFQAIVGNGWKLPTSVDKHLQVFRASSDNVVSDRSRNLEKLWKKNLKKVSTHTWQEGGSFKNKCFLSFFMIFHWFWVYFMGEIDCRLTCELPGDFCGCTLTYVDLCRFLSITASYVASWSTWVDFGRGVLIYVEKC